ALAKTGHFLTVCQHAFICYSPNQINTLSRAKYSIASLAQLLDACSQDIGFGYDIGCTNLITVFQSSIGNKAAASGLRFFVGAFHGYAHNHWCQIHFHPQVLTIAGLKDFETCEWVFSQENCCAHLFRHGSAFHHHMTLDWFYQTWDLDHHAALGE
ncbi:hypothetical protein DACRYDRAFT_52131, partial [Dacryopinax primogenitus]